MANQTREFLAERDLQIYIASRNGVSRANIAKKYGMSTSAVGKAIERQSERLERESLKAAPHLIRMELERMDYLLQGVMPYTQPMSITMPDGKKEILPPDVKYVTEARNIIKDRIKLLGLEQNNINVKVEAEPIKASLAGAGSKAELDEYDPRAQALEVLSIMRSSGMLDSDEIRKALGVDVEQLALESGTPVESDGIRPLAEILEELGPEEEDVDA